MPLSLAKNTSKVTTMAEVISDVDNDKILGDAALEPKIGPGIYHIGFVPGGAAGCAAGKLAGAGPWRRGGAG